MPMKRQPSVKCCFGIFVSTMLFFLLACGGGGGDSSSPTPTPTTTSLFTLSDSHSVTLAKVTGTAIQAYICDSSTKEVYSANTTLRSDNTFTMGFSLYPGGVVIGLSAIGQIDTSGNSATATISQPGVPNYQVTLTKTTSSLSGGYYGTYSGSNSGIFVAGVDGNGKVIGFSGNNIDGWNSFSTTLSGNTFTTTQSNGTTITGSISGNAATGTWRNTAAGQSGTFNGPKVF
jgi:hypothetical protein